MRRVALLVLAVVAVFVAFRFSAHAVRVAQLRTQVTDLTVKCAALNDEKHRLMEHRPPPLERETASLDASIDRCERDLESADLAWGAEQGRTGWSIVW